jgi:hypothetical protein
LTSRAPYPNQPINRVAVDFRGYGQPRGPGQSDIYTAPLYLDDPKASAASDPGRMASQVSRPAAEDREASQRPSVRFIMK